MTTKTPRTLIRIFGPIQGASLAAMLFAVLGSTTAFGQSDTNIFSDTFNGTGALGSNWSSSSATQGGGVATNPGSPNAFITVGGNFAQPTANYGDSNPADYSIRFTLTGYTDNSSNFIWGLADQSGFGDGNYILFKGDSDPMGITIDGKFVNTVARTSINTNGNFELDWYTDRVIVTNLTTSSVLFDSSTNIPSGGWSLPTVTLGPVFLNYSGGNSTIVGLSYDKISAVPEPATVALCGFASLLAFMGWRRKRG